MLIHFVKVLLTREEFKEVALSKNGMNKFVMHSAHLLNLGYLQLLLLDGAARPDGPVG